MKEKKGKLIALFISMRPFQWAKNMAVFAAILFNGQLFNPLSFNRTLTAFLVFCLLSSASYLINDSVDAPYDRLHPVKKFRPIAAGQVSIKEATILLVFLVIISFILSSTLGLGFTILAAFFLLLHLFYSFYLKKFSLLDILAISFSFILRSFGGEVASGYHLPIWLTFTVIFLSLFIASGKRLSELNISGKKTRPSLGKYGVGLLNFYLSIFSVATILSYSLFAYLAKPPKFDHPKLVNFLIKNMPSLIDRKWLMLTIVPVIFGMMRYSQLVFEKTAGEKPEKLLATDIPLFLSVFAWGMMLILIIYAL